MTILVQGQPIVAANAVCRPEDAFEASKHLNILQGDPIIVPADVKSVCVLQSESCCVPWDCGGYVGSQEATTCLIAFVLCQLGVNVVHFDESTSKIPSYLQSSVEGVEPTEEGVQLHLIGAYDDENGSGKKVLRNILNFYHQHSIRFNLRTAMIGALNTLSKEHSDTKFNIPLFHGACVDLTTKNIHPATFADRGPCLLLRQCRCMTGGPTTGVFDAKTGRFVFCPWEFHISPADALEFLKLSQVVRGSVGIRFIIRVVLIPFLLACP